MAALSFSEKAILETRAREAHRSTALPVTPFAVSMVRETQRNEY